MLRRKQLGISSHVAPWQQAAISVLLAHNFIKPQKTSCYCGALCCPIDMQIGVCIYPFTYLKKWRKYHFHSPL